MSTVHVGVTNEVAANRVLEWADTHHFDAYVVPGLEDPVPERVVVQDIDNASLGDLKEYLEAYFVKATYEVE